MSPLSLRDPTCLRDGPPRTARPLFVTGAPRSGTTALGHYLNRHPAILVCRERYKYLPPREIRPELFTFERILDYRPGETNLDRQRHVDMLAEKSAERLKWIGDKCPVYIRGMRMLARNNPGARFLVTFRPVEEVAESFEARARRAGDRWPAEKGFATGIEAWNLSLRRTRRFIQRSLTDRVLVVDYHRFFSDPGSLAPLLGDFLEVDFDESIVREWARMSSAHGERRRDKRPLSEEQRRLVEERTDRDAEAWILDRIARQERARPPRRGTRPWRVLEGASDRAIVAARR